MKPICSYHTCTCVRRSEEVAITVRHLSATLQICQSLDVGRIFNYYINTHNCTWQYLGVIHIYFYCINTYTSHHKHQILPFETLSKLWHILKARIAQAERVAKFQRFAGDMAPSPWIQLWGIPHFGGPKLPYAN